MSRAGVMVLKLAGVGGLIGLWMVAAVVTWWCLVTGVWT